MAVFKTPRGPRGRWLGSTAAGWRSASADVTGALADAANEWDTFERRRHLMKPPGLFDEGERKFDKFGEPLDDEPSVATGSRDVGSSVQKASSGDSARRRSTSSTAKTAAPEELGLRKARFFDSCLRADRALEMPRLPSPGPPRSAREKDPRLRRAEEDGGRDPKESPSQSRERHPTDARSARESRPQREDSDSTLPTLNQSLGGLVNSCKRAKIPPATTGIIRTAGKKLELQYGCVTDERAEAIALSLRATSSEVDEAHFRSNGLGERGAKYLLSALPDSVRLIDISQNELGHSLSSSEQYERHGCWCSEFRRMAQLRTLNASFSALGDAVCKELCKALTSCRALTELNLSGNSIYKEGARALGNLMRGHKAMQDLDAHFNHIVGDSARDLVKGLHEHTQAGGSLRSLNLSWNPLGKAGGEETCRAMAQLFAEGSSLTHVDIAKCDLAFSHCQILADGLQSNTTILGIHIQGNAGRMDARGFLVPVQSPLQAPVGKPSPERALEGSQLESMARINRSTSVQEEGTCCWVCDRWREICLRYLPGVSGPDAAEVWVFTSMDSFEQPLKMKKHGAEFVLYLMAPAGTLRYLFQVGNELLPSRTAPLLRGLRPPLQLRRMRQAGEAAAGGEEEAEGDPLLVEVTSCSTLSVTARGLDEPVRRAFVPRRGCDPQGEVPREGWSIQQSLFAPYEEALVRRPFCESCFDADWRQADIPSLLTDETSRAQVKELLRAHYAEVKMLYASNCSVSYELARQDRQDREDPLSFGVSLHEYTHLLVQHNLVGDDLSLEDADAIFIVSTLPPPEAFEKWHDSIQKNGHVLLRHSFIEFLVRVALHHSSADKKGKSAGHSLEHLLNKHIMYPYPPMKNIFKCVQWRADVLHTEVVEAVYRKHMPDVVSPLFQAFSSTKPSQERFLMLEDWFALLDALQVLSCQGNDGQMHAWDRAWLWQMSAMSHVDELTSCRHLELVFVEFLEALARLVALLRSRQRAAMASAEEEDRWDYGLGMPSAASIFCCDKEAVMDKKAFAKHLDTFFSSDAVKRALAQQQTA